MYYGKRYATAVSRIFFGEQCDLAALLDLRRKEYLTRDLHSEDDNRCSQVDLKRVRRLNDRKHTDFCVNTDKTLASRHYPKGRSKRLKSVRVGPDPSVEMAGIATGYPQLEPPLVRYLAPTVPFKAIQLVLTEESLCKL